MSEVDVLLLAAWKDAAQLRAFIRTIEWAGTSIVGYDGFSADSCPSCGGLKPGSIVEDEKRFKPSDWDHAPECKLVAALGPDTTSATVKSEDT